MSVDCLSEFTYSMSIGGISMDILKVFGENVKFYRTKKGISQEKFGEMCNLHRTYISDIERFNRNISLENIQKIADALELHTY